MSPDPGQAHGMGTAIDVWRIAPEPIADELEAVEARLGLLPPSERARREAMASPGEARFWAATRVAIRLLIARQCGPAFVRAELVAEPSGRPTIEGCDTAIAISHSRPLALFAVSHGPVGVDLEARRTVSLSRARRAAIEAAAIDIAGGMALPEADPARFIAAWCRLEALAKATGLGVARTLTELGIRGERGGVATRARTAGWAVRDLKIDAGFAAAVAGPSPPPVIALRRFPEDAAALHAWIADGPQLTEA